MTKVLKEYLRGIGYIYTKGELPDILNPNRNKDMLQFGLEKLKENNLSDFPDSMTFGS